MITEPSKNRGFTLVELAVVMVVLAIMAAVAIPYGLNYVKHYEVQGAGQNVASLMQLTRAQSVKRNTRRGLILNFNYPSPGEYQFTSLEEDPVTGGYPAPVYVDPGGNFDPGDRNYGKAPEPQFSTDKPTNGLDSPHGQVIPLPNEIAFIEGQAYSSLLFRVDGSVEAVNPVNVDNGKAVAMNGLDWEVRIQHPRYGLTRTIRISRSGRVVVENP